MSTKYFFVFQLSGDLIECLQNFANMAGMKEDMVDLITRSEGTFRLVSVPLVVLCSFTSPRRR